jgi:hypothetical protein
MSAIEIIDRMRSAYVSARTYSDRGIASSGRLKVTFETRFVRGSQIRFAFGNMVIWSDGEHTYTHWPEAARIGQPEIIDDGRHIGLPFKAAAGVSLRAASTVPPLLLPVSIGLAPIGELKHEGDEYIGNHLCARIDEQHSSAHSTKLWVDRDTYLLRRIITFRGLEVETTTSYEPSVEPIDLGSIERPDVEKTRPQPRKPIPWTGVSIEMDSRRINRIEPSSPATRSSLAIGDEVEAVNGHRMNGMIDFLDAVREVNIGEQVALTVRRGGNTQAVLVQVEAAPSFVTASPSTRLVE